MSNLESTSSNLPVKCLWTPGLLFPEKVRALLFIGEDEVDNQASFTASYDLESIYSSGDALAEEQLVFGYLSANTHPNYRRRGHLTRLTSALAHLSIGLGFSEIGGWVESQYTLQAFARIFGEERLTYRDYHVSPPTFELPMSLRQAVGSLERAEAYEDDLESSESGFGVDIDLSGLRQDDFEAPILLNQPELPAKDRQ